MAEISQIQKGSITYDLRDASKAPLASPAFSGTPTAPTPSADDDSTRIATTAFVKALMRAAEAMVYKGTIGASGATVTELPANHTHGWTYKVATAGTYAGTVCEVGDMIICVKDGTVAANADWSVIQSNIDGAVIGPSSSTANRVATFDGTSGKVIKDSGFTIGADVPAGAKFTDTQYEATKENIGSASAGTAIAADDITKWNAGTMPTFVVENGVLIINDGAVPELEYTARSIPNISVNQKSVVTGISEA